MVTDPKSVRRYLGTRTDHRTDASASLTFAPTACTGENRLIPPTRPLRHRPLKP